MDCWVFFLELLVRVSALLNSFTLFYGSVICRKLTVMQIILVHGNANGCRSLEIQLMTALRTLNCFCISLNTHFRFLAAYMSVFFEFLTKSVSTFYWFPH